MSKVPTNGSHQLSDSKPPMSAWLTFVLGFLAGLLLAVVGMEKWGWRVKSDAPRPAPPQVVSEVPHVDTPAVEPAAKTPDMNEHAASENATDHEDTEAPEHDMEITSAMRNRMLTVDFLDLLQDAELHRFRFEGETKGVTLSKIRSGSIYEKAGFKDGDVIEQINGIAVADIEKKQSKMKHDLPAANRIVFKVRRNNKVIKIQVRVAGLGAE